MPTTFYLRDIPSSTGTAGDLTLSQRQGRGVATSVTTITAGGAAQRLTQTAGGQVIRWVSEPATAASGGATNPIGLINIRGLESANNVNAKLQVLVEYRPAGGGTIVLLPQQDIVATELTTTQSARTATNVASSGTLLQEGDRIRVTLFVAPTTTFGNGTVTVFYNGPQQNASGDSRIAWTDSNIRTSDIVDVSPFEIKGSTSYYG